MDKAGGRGYFSGMHHAAVAATTARPDNAASPALRLVPFREVRHEQPDDCIHCEPVATRLAQMNWTIPAHRHEGLHQFQFLAAGTIEGSIDGQPFQARAPALLMLAPGAMHGFVYSHDARGHQVTVPSATLRRLLDGSALADDGLAASFVLDRLGTAQARRVADLLGQIEREFGASNGGRVHALLALTTLLAVETARLCGERLSEPAGRRGARDTLVQRFQALVERHYRAQWSLAAYAAALGVTADHLSRNCKAVTGQGAMQVVHARVLREARRLLAYTPMTVAEIAVQTGFPDAAYFSRFFRRGAGATPTAYRRLVASGVRGA